MPSKLELKFEKLYLKLFLPRARHSTRGASKRYAGLRHGAALDAVEFVGMEVVRRDWTALAKQVQRELYQRLFTDQAVDVYLADIVRRVRSGRAGRRARLSQEPAQGRRGLHGHDAAARRRGAQVDAVVRAARSATSSRPRARSPLDNVEHPLDREHYVDEAGAAGRGAGAGNARPGFRAGDRRQPAVRHVLAVRRAVRPSP